MGTNYYARLNICLKCQRASEEIHLGKSSHGWQFSFQYNEGKYYKNVPEMKKWLKDKYIYNEYDELISHKDFWKMVKLKQTKKNLNHAKWMRDNSPNRSREEDFIIDGYSFSDVEFS